MESNHNNYTDTSLQYADDESDDDVGNAANLGERGSNANSGSYGSRNQTNTLPLQQQQPNPATPRMQHR